MTPTIDPAKLEDVPLLREAIRLSGLSDRRFASQVLIRNERTVRRMLAGDSALSSDVRTFLVQYVLDRRATRRALRSPHSPRKL